ncbi:hypothetical protein MIND_00904300 [Mycena indigotica]|uniref:Uncharacterized protein n=1 Tax=Mycena indigotica TaxID=2126181 RepID=A0A8H6SD39_9AGAR|nr:uncharacterized protein MIND_00904300 [Mycena indigotica]KAF7296737.1 hypothetical protein MIND_00904300 [Mycena indigotica]
MLDDEIYEGLKVALDAGFVDEREDACGGPNQRADSPHSHHHFSFATSTTSTASFALMTAKSAAWARYGLGVADVVEAGGKHRWAKMASVTIAIFFWSSTTDTFLAPAPLNHIDSTPVSVSRLEKLASSLPRVVPGQYHTVLVPQKPTSSSFWEEGLRMAAMTSLLVAFPCLRTAAISH